ncbi:hypothetical protein V2G26_000663 [Clonostachys chloroleuca]
MYINKYEKNNIYALLSPASKCMLWKPPTYSEEPHHGGSRLLQQDILQAFLGMGSHPSLQNSLSIPANRKLFAMLLCKYGKSHMFLFFSLFITGPLSTLRVRPTGDT